MYGILLLFPRLLFIFRKDDFYNQFKIMVYFIYVSHYLSFNLRGGILVAIYGLPSVLLSILDSDEKNYKTDMWRGLKYMIGALFIQELFGHWISGDPASRLEAVPNAIVYATYYGVNGFWY